MMVSSPPSSPDGPRPGRPQSMYSLPSPDVVPKSRPQSMIQRPARSNSRMSQSSRQGMSRTSDDDGRTSVKVVVRVRPPLGPSDPGFDLIPQRFQRSTVQVNTGTSLGVESPQGRKIFIFDRVFGEDTSQKSVWEYLQDSVESFLQGYNVSILAYGQSGAGKSYTMGTSGPIEQRDPSLKGVIPRAAQLLFDNLNEAPVSHSRQHSGLKTPTRFSVSSMNQILQSAKSSPGKSWDMSVTYVEIYNEQPRDLLLDENMPLSERPSVQIREDQKGRIFVEGLKAVPIKSVDDLMDVLNHGSTIRQTDATAINARSSRSHAVFTVNLRQTKGPGSVTATKDKRPSSAMESWGNGEPMMTVESKLHFVDLAGSERLKNTGATGDRAKEGISINAGLASLGKVIAQLSSRSTATYVSYRDSKLTRMLQDSLGGTAITYMIACVTPAEFHLSETLNTVQYAQRARNIQSKPKIQQINDDADKQAVIDRLRSEVAFLRQQIRSAENGERRGGAFVDRSDRPSERENEIQNQLLDVQESYTALSQRHAKLISELTRSGAMNDQTGPLINESAMDRLKRSQANQQQIEQVVLEYEKTIQSLEATLLTTRSSLATTESNLLEKETKCVYVETMNQQLNSRVQKLMERESNTDTYLNDLEGRLEDKSSGGEKSDGIISDLRKEITRIRESESNAEDYICTLEERLAEADQDMETMQREVDRLEHLVERQRSLGRLDNLLYELDHVQRKDGKSPNLSPAQLPKPLTNGVHHEKEAEPSLSSLKEAEDVELPNGVDDDLDEPVSGEDLQSTGETDEVGLQRLAKVTSHSPSPLKPQPDMGQILPSPAQSRYVADKFESVSQELFDLRLEHESTVTELDLLSAKYNEALRTLAEMQDSFDEARHSRMQGFDSSADNSSRPASFLEDARPNEHMNGRHLSSSRSLSTELSLAGESHTSTDTDLTPVSKQPTSVEVASQEIERLQILLSEHERDMSTVNDQYSQLKAEHKDTLTTVEKLKAEVHRNRPASPSALPSMLRRMTSQIGSGSDRAQRSIVSLRSLIAEEFDDKPHRMEVAEMHLTAATHELQARMERIQALESEVKTAKREMEMKSTIISGLTRERNSMKAGSPVDLSMVSQMRDQLIQKETELKSLHEGYARREQELQEEIRSLSAERERQHSITSTGFGATTEQGEAFKSLQQQVSDLTGRHQAAQQSAEESEKRLTMTKAELDSALASVEIMKTRQQSISEESMTEQTAAVEQERQHYQGVVVNLKNDLEAQNSLNAVNKGKIAELVQLHDALSQDALAHAEIIKSREKQISELKGHITGLEKEVRDAQSAVEFHKHGLKTLHQAHANEIEEMKLSHAGNLAGYDDQMSEMTNKHEKAIRSHKNDVDVARQNLQKLIDSLRNALGHPTNPDMAANHVQDLVEEKRHIAEANTRLTSTNAELERQLTGRQNLQELEEKVAEADSKISHYQETIRNLANEVGNHEETIRGLEQKIKTHESTITNINAEKQKKADLIEELEQQLQNSFDQHHNRVSIIQAQGNQALVEAQQRILSLEKGIDTRGSFNEIEINGSRTNTMKSQHRPQSPPQIDSTQPRSNSMTSALRKSASIASLPSPPPAIPLPPLPTLPGLSLGPVNNPSPPQSRHASKEVSIPGSNNMTSNMMGAPSPNSQPKSRHSVVIEEQDHKMRTLEKHLHAEKQLTATLEEAMVDLETQSNKLRADADSWKKKAWAMEEELSGLKKERKTERLSVQAVEEEVKKRQAAEAARAQLEERMRLLTVGKDGKKVKRKGGGLNCF